MPGLAQWMSPCEPWLHFARSGFYHSDRRVDRERNPVGFIATTSPGTQEGEGDLARPIFAAIHSERTGFVRGVPRISSGSDGGPGRIRGKLALSRTL